MKEKDLPARLVHMLWRTHDKCNSVCSVAWSCRLSADNLSINAGGYFYHMQCSQKCHITRPIIYCFSCSSSETEGNFDQAFFWGKGNGVRLRQFYVKNDVDSLVLSYRIWLLSTLPCGAIQNNINSSNGQRDERCNLYVRPVDGWTWDEVSVCLRGEGLCSHGRRRHVSVCSMEAIQSECRETQ